MRVEVERTRCTGHGRCYSLAPDVFTPDEQGLSVVIAAEVGDDLSEQARAGEANCPERAIRLS
jgi:ferredoxin